MTAPASAPVLLTGATGFVGRALQPVLREAGWAVRCATRRPGAARSRQPEQDWVRLDLAEEATLAPALRGCQAAVYLVHGIGEGHDYAEREARLAARFRRAAAAAGVRRIVYLGGVCPATRSKHLEGRRATGLALRGPGVELFELRAGMIVGAGSASWEIVRAVAGLPLRVQPPWVERASWPIAIADVVSAIAAALRLPAADAGCYELPGPQRLTHRELLARASAALGGSPRTLPVPWLPTRLSSHAVSWLAGVPQPLVRELLRGIVVDLDPSGRSFWAQLGRGPATSLAAAIASALAAEARRATARAG